MKRVKISFVINLSATLKMHLKNLKKCAEIKWKSSFSCSCVLTAQTGRAAKISKPIAPDSGAGLRVSFREIKNG